MRWSILSMLVRTSCRSSTLGSTTCCRLNISSWRVSPAARVAGLADLLDVRAHGVGGLQLREDELAVAQDDGQDVVEVVRDAAGQRPMASIFCACRSCSSLWRSASSARVAPCLGSLSLGEIGHEGDALRVIEHRDTDQHRDAASVLPERLLLPRGRNPLLPQLGDGDFIGVAPLGRRLV